MLKKLLLVYSIVLSSLLAHSQQISLAGEWHVRLDPNNLGKGEHWFEGFSGMKLKLPGTLDDAKIGEKTILDATSINKSVLLSLTRKHRFIGSAWYTKEINLSHDISGSALSLERVIWRTECWIDGNYKGSAESLSTPHRFEIGFLKAGKHKILLKIDNRKQYDISFNNFAHAYTDGTQIIWNGVVGRISLSGETENRIENLQIYPNALEKSIKVDFSVKNLPSAFKTRYEVYKSGKLMVSKVDVQKTTSPFIINEIHLKKIVLWDEFDPNLYTLRLVLLDMRGREIAQKTTSFGFRQLGNKDGTLTLNGKRIFLRGTLDCNSYPVQGHPPMDKRGWIKVFTTIKDYGLNHVRYHSWCPPEAAFQVADSLGLYLQVELPLWSLKVGEDPATLKFLESESQRIIAAYGNHPSFCFWSLGNELEGDFNWLNSLVAKLKIQDPRRFYTATTFSFQKGHGLYPEPNDDIFVTQYTRDGWVRGQGIFNAKAPNFNQDYQTNSGNLKVPLIAHEVGQYSVFPNLREIEKYTGVLEPLNFKTIRHDLMSKKLYRLADSFTLASGKLAALLYKEEIERALKTRAFSGFQLLDLHDFPGQGTALVGLLDAFWDSKGLIKPQAFRSFCSSVVPLLRYERASYLNSESFEAEMQVANFSKKQLIGKILWKVYDQQGKIVKSGSTSNKRFSIGTYNAGKIDIDLSRISTPSQLTFEMAISGTTSWNTWNFWVYPNVPSLESKKVLITKSKSEAYQALALGKTVILNPDTSMITGVPGRFTPVFWSPVHFSDQPGSMGLLCNPNHPIFKAFPTTFHSSWQWWDLITKSKSIIIPDTDGPKPIVRIIDNFYRNRSMATLIEAKVGKGKLILSTMDISNNLKQRIEARQLRNSIISYAEAKAFNPKIELSISDLDQWLK